MGEEIFGIDYSSNGELTSTGDLMLVSGLDNAKQAIHNRLMTDILVYDYLEDYGCNLDELVGEPTNHNSLQLLDLIIRDSLNLEPRVQEVLELECSFDSKAIIAEMSLLLVDNSVIDLTVQNGGDY
jgi:phage baseplate assembly protein W